MNDKAELEKILENQRRACVVAYIEICTKRNLVSDLDTHTEIVRAIMEAK